MKNNSAKLSESLEGSALYSANMSQQRAFIIYTVGINSPICSPEEDGPQRSLITEPSNAMFICINEDYGLDKMVAFNDTVCLVNKLLGV